MKPADPLAYLPPDVAGAFELAAEAAGLPAWRRVASFRRTVEVAAARELMSDCESRGMSRTTAIASAARTLNINEKTLASLLYRWGV